MGSRGGASAHEYGASPGITRRGLRLASPTAEELRRLDKVRLPSGEQLVLILTDVRPGRYDALSDEQKTSLRAQLAQRSQGVDFTAFRGALAGFYHQAEPVKYDGTALGPRQNSSRGEARLVDGGNRHKEGQRLPRLEISFRI